MARKSKKAIELEQIKSTLIVWWIAMVCLLGIGFISILYIQYDTEDNKELTTLSDIKIEEKRNYGDNITPVNIHDYSTLINGQRYNFYTLDESTEINDEKKYGNKERIDNSGIISILKNGSYLSDSIPEKDRKAIIQLALWMYNGYLDEYQKSAVLNGTYASQINELLNKAKDEDYNQSSVVLNTNTPSITLSKDKKYYVSEIIKLEFSNKHTVVDYKIDLSDAPKGTKMIDENGKEIKDITKVTKFYLKIPEKNVNSKNKDFKISVDVTTSDYYAYAFRTAVNKSKEADVILDDLQIVLNHSDYSISLHIEKDTPPILIDQRTILGFLALCITSAICGIIILIIMAIQSRKELKEIRKKNKRK